MDLHRYKMNHCSNDEAGPYRKQGRLTLLEEPPKQFQNVPSSSTVDQVEKMCKCRNGRLRMNCQGDFYCEFCGYSDANTGRNKQLFQVGKGHVPLMPATFGDPCMNGPIFVLAKSPTKELLLNKSTSLPVLPPMNLFNRKSSITPLIKPTEKPTPLITNNKSSICTNHVRPFSGKPVPLMKPYVGDSGSIVDSCSSTKKRKFSNDQSKDERQLKPSKRSRDYYDDRIEKKRYESLLALPNETGLPSTQGPKDKNLSQKIEELGNEVKHVIEENYPAKSSALIFLCGMYCKLCRKLIPGDLDDIFRTHENDQHHKLMAKTEGESERIVNNGLDDADSIDIRFEDDCLLISSRHQEPPRMVDKDIMNEFDDSASLYSAVDGEMERSDGPEFEDVSDERIDETCFPLNTAKYSSQSAGKRYDRTKSTRN